MGNVRSHEARWTFPGVALDRRRAWAWRTLGVAVGVAILLGAGRPAAQLPTTSPAQRQVEPIVPVPVTAPVAREAVALGERLFYDVRLSGDGTRSCASCHPTDRGGMDGRPRAIAADGTTHARNTPTIFNVGLSATFNWDGGTASLETHAEGVLLSPALMNTQWPALLARLSGDDGYRTAFRALDPEGVTRRAVLAALAAFERSLQTPNARFDRYLRGEPGALTSLEARGYQLFKAYGCVTCHQGVNVGGNLFQKFGVFAEAGDDGVPEPDLGRYQVTGVPRDRGVFRVPSLRNVAATAPYFHDGRARTLDVAVDTMGKVQLGRTLSPDEVAAIVAFLGTLTGEYRGRPVASVSP
jgi:cytochrome c peroxidase